MLHIIFHVVRSFFRRRSPLRFFASVFSAVWFCFFGVASAGSALEGARYFVNAPCLDVPRASSAVAVVDGRIYRAGGTRSGDPSPRVDVFDPKIGAWSTVRDLPFPVRSAEAVEVDGFLYVIGGRTQAAASALQEIQIYNPNSNNWLPGPTLIAPMTDAAAERLASGKIFLAGGRTNTFSGDLDLSDTLQVFEPGDDRWFLETPIPEVVERAASVAIGSKLWLFGGAGFNGVIDSVWIYDEDARVWEAGPTLPFPLLDADAVHLDDGRILLAGGRRTRDGASLDSQWILDPGADAWRELPNLPQPSADGGIVVLRDEVILIGGFVKTSSGGTSEGPTTETVQHIAPDGLVRTCF